MSCDPVPSASTRHSPDVATWCTSDGRPLDPWEQRLVACCTKDEWEQALALVAMDADLAADRRRTAAATADPDERTDSMNDEDASA
jgi:hypothetical protein